MRLLDRCQTRLRIRGRSQRFRSGSMRPPKWDERIGICTTDAGSVARILTQNCVTQLRNEQRSSRPHRPCGIPATRRVLILRRTRTDPSSDVEAKPEMLAPSAGLGPRGYRSPCHRVETTMSKPVLPSQMASRRRSPAGRTVARLALVATVARTVMRTRSQRDQALRDLGAARTLLRREAWLEHQLREVAAAAASGEISEHDLADMAASRLKNLLDSMTAGRPARRSGRPHAHWLCRAALLAAPAEVGRADLGGTGDTDAPARAGGTVRAANRRRRRVRRRPRSDLRGQRPGADRGTDLGIDHGHHEPNRRVQQRGRAAPRSLRAARRRPARHRARARAGQVPGPARRGAAGGGNRERLRRDGPTRPRQARGGTRCRSAWLSRRRPRRP